ncbi:hypothetical protein Lpl7_0184 [Lacticaseibacillus paracasei subsp. tolerans Lpl7]|nr:hypothetical protein Lpl7_0184 [Lacticaseibacillus paracasei subsp. tolerans Lpl7]
MPSVRAAAVILPWSAISMKLRNVCSSINSPTSYQPCLSQTASYNNYTLSDNDCIPFHTAGRNYFVSHARHG